MMARPHIAKNTPSRVHRSILFILGRSGFHDLLLGAPRVWPTFTTVSAAGPLEDTLRHHRRGLWRRRTQIVMARFIAIGMLYLIAANLALLALAPDTPPAIRWVPAILLVLAGIWLSFALRPSTGETAQLLDRRFRLHEAIGTALEFNPERQPGAVAHQQMAYALATVQKLPRKAWQDGRHKRPWALSAALVAGVALSTFLIAQVGPHSATRSAAGPPIALGAHHVPLTQLHPNLVSPTNPSLSPPTLQQKRIQDTNRPNTSHQPILSTSLQVRTGPQLAAVATANGAPPAMLTGKLNGSGNGPNSAAQQQAAAQGKAGTSQRNGNTGNSGQSAQQGAQLGQGQNAGQSNNSASGQSGNGGQQQPQSGPQTSPNQTQRGGSGNTGPQGQNQGQSSQQNGRSSANRTGNRNANPFGQDPSASQAGQKGSRSGSQHTGGGQPAARGQQSRNSGSSQANSGRTSRSTSQNNPADPMQHGRYSSGNGQIPQQPTTQPGKAGPAHGRTVVVGSQPIVKNGSKGQELVRVVPFGAASGPGMGGPAGGSNTVQGYVPEEDVTLAPDEQALVRAYFSNGSGS